MLLLNIPEKKRSLAVSRGAVPYISGSGLCAVNPEDYDKFAEFIWPDYRDWEELAVLTDHVFIVEGLHTCGKCGKQTRVLGFGVGNYYCFGIEENDSGDACSVSVSFDESGFISVIPFPDGIPKRLLDYCLKRWNFARVSSGTSESGGLQQFCEHCGSQFGSYLDIFGSSGPFSCLDEKRASCLKLHEVGLIHDVPIRGSIDIFDSTSWMIDRYARKDYLFDI